MGPQQGLLSLAQTLGVLLPVVRADAEENGVAGMGIGMRVSGLVAGRRLGDAPRPRGDGALGVARPLGSERREVRAEARRLLGRDLGAGGTPRQRGREQYPEHESQLAQRHGSSPRA